MDIGFLLEQVHQQATAIEAFFLRHATPEIGDAEQGVCVVDDLAHMEW